MSSRRHLDEEYALLTEKLHALRLELAIETDAATKFKLRQQIAEAEAARQRIEHERDGLARLTESCPYRGLSVFREADAPYFFGRDACVAKILDAMSRSAFTAILGASGSGKSSLVYAGVIPELRRQRNVLIAALRPGEHPLQALSAALLPFLDATLSEVDQLAEISKLTEHLCSGHLRLGDILERIHAKHPDSSLLIVIDQFEELYTLDGDVEQRRRQMEERQCVVDELCALLPKPEVPLSVIITLRSDFLDQTNSQPALSHLIANNEIIVPAMNTEELRQAIAEPARRAGQPLSAEVVDLLIQQSAGRDGALPLLEFALTRIWEGLAHGVDAADTLKQIGGVGGALANQAQDLFDGLDAAEQQIARRAFLAMIRLGEGAKDTRRRVKIADIVAHHDDPQQVRRVLNHFARPGARLITLADDSAEITHEALFEHWEALTTWLDASRDDLRFHRQLEDTVKEWAAQDRPDGSLWRPPKLDLLRQYHQRNQQDMTALQVAFWQHSARQDKRTRFWKRMTRAGLVLLTILSVIGALWAMRSERIAQEERRNAQIQEIEALNQTAKALFLSKHYELEALITGIKVGKKLRLPHIPKKLYYQGVFNLHEIVYGIHERNRLENHNDAVLSLDFSPDDKLLASGCADGTIKLWNFSNGQEVATLQGYSQSVSIVKFNPAGTILAFGSSDKTIKLWNVRTGKIIMTLEGHSASISSLAFHPNHTLLASGASDGTIKLWDIVKSKEIMTLNIGDDIIRNLNFYSNGKILASGNEDGTITFWSIPSGDEITTIELDFKYPRSIAFSKDGSLLATTRPGEGYPIKIWDIKNGVEATELRGHIWGANSVSFSNDSKMLASGSDDYTVKLWDIEKRTEIITLHGHFAEVNSVTFNPEDTVVASGGNDYTIKLWNLQNKIKSTRKNFPFQSNCLSFSPNGKILAVDVGLLSMDIRLWQIGNNHKINELQIQKDSFKGIITMGIAFSPDSKILALGGDNGIITLWDIENGEEIKVLPKKFESVQSIAFSPSKDMLAIATENAVAIWDIENDREVKAFQEDSHSIKIAIFSPDGIMLAIGKTDNTIDIWKMENDSKVTILKGHSGMVRRLDFHPNGQILASGSNDHTIKLWNLSSGEEITTLLGHHHSISDIDFSSDGTMLVSASIDGVVKVWDGINGKEIITLQNYTNSGYTNHIVKFSPDNTMLALGTPDGIVKVWNLELDDLLARGCTWLYGYLKHNPNVSDADRHLCDDILRAAE